MDHPLQETKEVPRGKEPIVGDGPQHQLQPVSQTQHQHSPSPNQQQASQPSQPSQQHQQHHQIQQPPVSTPNTETGQQAPIAVANLLAGQRQRMITTAGQIREIADPQNQDQASQEQQQNSESYEQHHHHHLHHQQQTPQQQVVASDYHQQIVQEGATYAAYEPPSSSASNVTEVKTVQIAHGRVPEREKVPNGHLGQTQTVYVVREHDETFYRPQHPSMRYSDERFQRYQYYPPPMVKAEIEAQSAQVSSHGQSIIYETEAVETVVAESSPHETKAQYTNLEPMQNISYFPPGYSAGNVAYLHGPSPKEEYYIQGSPNPVLYKSKYNFFTQCPTVTSHLLSLITDDPTLTSTIPGKSLHYAPLAGPQPVYESSQPGSPNGQTIYTYCKPEPPYWHTEYNGTNVSE